jgi:hypothetical protein
VEKGDTDPFEVEVKKVLSVLKKYLSHWKAFEDFILDAETLSRIASIIRLQGQWLKHRSTALYVDPLLIELKMKIIEGKRLADIFSKSWHPIAEMEGLTKKRVDEATEYWNQLLPLDQRKVSLPTSAITPGAMTLEELIRLRIMSEETFNETLKSFWEELKERVGSKKKISYWSFILAKTYEDTIYRAYLTSFLVTYGYVHMEVDVLEEKTFLMPYDEAKMTFLNKQNISVPIAIDYDLWSKKREEISID